MKSGNIAGEQGNPSDTPYIGVPQPVPAPRHYSSLAGKKEGPGGMEPGLSLARPEGISDIASYTHHETIHLYHSLAVYIQKSK